MKIAIVIIFNNTLNHKIIYLKKKFKNNFKTCLYLNDFPHLTLITIEIKSTIKNIEKNLQLKKNYLKQIDLGKGKIFENDILTKGDTYYFSVKKSYKLVKTQMKIAEKLKHFALKKKEILKLLTKKKIEKKNYKKYGFPFIRNNWKPHISICSVLDNKKETKFKKKFKKLKFNKNFLVKDILLCEVKKNKLIKRKIINVL